MITPTLRILLGIFLIAHGLIHFSLTYVPTPEPGGLHTPFFPSWWRANTDPAWPVLRLGLHESLARYLGSALWLFTTVGFALVGLGLMGAPLLNAWWPNLAVAASVASLLFLILFWHPWLVMGIAINIAVLAAILVFHWPQIPVGA